MQKYLLIFLLLFSLNSCEIWYDFLNYIEGGETYNYAGKENAEQDSPPPMGYHQNFLKSIEKYHEHFSKQVEITRIDKSNPDKIRVYFHLIGNDSLFLTGANEISNIWCKIIDSTDRTNIVKKFKIKHSHPDEISSMSFAIVMDHSGSMGTDRSKIVQHAVNDFINRKKSSDDIALIRYDDKVSITHKTSNNTNSLLRSNPINGLEGYGGMTATADAIDRAISELSYSDAAKQKVIIVFTDGIDNSSNVKSDIIIKRAKAENVLLAAFDYGKNVKKGFLKNITDKSGGIYNHIYSKSEFKDLFNDIYLRLNNYYVMEYTPDEYGVHKIRLELCVKDSIITAEAEFENIPEPGSLSLIDVLFDINKSSIKPESMKAVNKLIKLMKLKSDMRIELQGHTDNTGQPEYNLKLSQRRAESVMALLIKSGIPKNRITAIGYGDTKPIASNENEEGRRLNRRTAFKVIK